MSKIKVCIYIDEDVKEMLDQLYMHHMANKVKMPYGDIITEAIIDLYNLYRRPKN